MLNLPFLLCALLLYCVQIDNTKAQQVELPLCTDRVARYQPCRHDDTNCGSWTSNRTYIPHKCRYRDITPAEARQCVGSRTIACIGDSIVRDMCNGIGMFLSGADLREAPDVKFDRHSEMNLSYAMATKFFDFKSWKVNKDGYNGLIYPKVGTNPDHWTWQVQSWLLINDELLDDHRLEDVLTGKVAKENTDLRKVDFAFWNYGLHQQELWSIPSYGEKYYNHFVARWLNVRKTSPIPLVWTSFNEYCPSANKRIQAVRFVKQAQMVKEANQYTRTKLRAEKLPFYDLAAPLRSPELCEISADGFHVKMWVDFVRAQIMFNYLCDEKNVWRGEKGFA